MAMVDDATFSARDVQDLTNRVDELEAAAAATLHVNQHLNKQVENLMRSLEAMQAECQAWKDRSKWLSKQLVLARKQQAHEASPVDEEEALAEMLARYETRAVSEADHTNEEQPSTSGSDPGVQPTAAQVHLIKQLTARGRAAGWIINPSEVEMGPVLGRGEFGVTYQCRWRGATVAVKQVRTRSVQDYTSFLREVEALAALRHPHVLSFLGACLIGPDKFWLVTEYMEGGTLAQWLHPHKYKKDLGHVQDIPGDPFSTQPQPQSQHPHTAHTAGPNGVGPHGNPGALGKPKPFLERVRMACEVAQGLFALESLNPPLLHRDVKPSNIFVDGGGHARVGDFGLSRRLLPEAVADLTGETGTYLYMAPEVMRHEVYDSKADVWSWGVLFVEALTNQTPYSGSYLTPEQVALGVADEHLKPRIPENVDTDLQAIARLALEFNPDDRPSFALITQELYSTYQRLTGQQSAAPTNTLLATVSRQLTKSWFSLLGHIYGNAPAALTSGAGSPTAAAALARSSTAPVI